MSSGTAKLPDVHHCFRVWAGESQSLPGRKAQLENKRIVQDRKFSITKMRFDNWPSSLSAVVQIRMNNELFFLITSLFWNNLKLTEKLQRSFLYMCHPLSPRLLASGVNILHLTTWLLKSKNSFHFEVQHSFFQNIHFTVRFTVFQHGEVGIQKKRGRPHNIWSWRGTLLFTSFICFEIFHNSKLKRSTMRGDLDIVRS